MDFDCKSRMWINLSFLLLIFSFVSTESKILKTKSQDKFVAAVYEHKPITALPICYEMGEYDKIFIWSEDVTDKIWCFSTKIIAGGSCKYGEGGQC